MAQSPNRITPAKLTSHIGPPLCTHTIHELSPRAECSARLVQLRSVRIPRVQLLQQRTQGLVHVYGRAGPEYERRLPVGGVQQLSPRLQRRLQLRGEGYAGNLGQQRRADQNQPFVGRRAVGFDDGDLMFILCCLPEPELHLWPPFLLQRAQESKGSYPHPGRAGCM